MKVYLVGGAVRDKLMAIPVKERDWVVVGAKEEELLKQGYQKVGRDFPVFLHPKTKEEYALARTERKQGSGYYGFVCDASPNVSLEEDLQRRDLTINAMAMDDKGNIIDPYHGQQDIQNKVLRHVSKAFMEDPVRVLRVARFAARYHHLGFSIAEETKSFMYQLARSGELKNLVAERVWQEWQKSLEEKNPEIFISLLRSSGALEAIIPELDALFGVPNPQKHHPEVDTGIHSLMSLQIACELSSDPKVRFAALVHDLGKALSPETEWPSHHGHEQKGVALIQKLAKRLRIPADYRHLAELVSRFHLDIHRFHSLKPETKLRLLERADAFRRPQIFEQLLLACEADSRGRGPTVSQEYPQAKLWRKLLALCAKITVQDIADKTLAGEQIKKALQELRIAAIKQHWNEHEE